MDQRERKKGLVDRANSAIDTYRNARGAFGMAQKGLKVARAAQMVIAAESNPVGWIITAVILIIVIFVVIIIVTTGGGGTGSANPAPTTNPNPVTSIASCPVPDGAISTPSYQADQVNGHCGSSYGTSCNPNSRRAKSIDVLTNGKNVVLPTIEGGKLNWAYLGNFSVGSGDCSAPNLSDTTSGPCGTGLVFSAGLGNGKNWTLHLVHMRVPLLKKGQTYLSGTVIGKSALPDQHIHITVGKDILDPSISSGGDETQPGWIPADIELGMCTPEPANTGGICQEGATDTYCSARYLQNFFPDPTVAHKMSIICNRESGGRPDGFNGSCQIPGGTLDYSGGLFQINLLAHTIDGGQGNVLDCPSAFKSSADGGLVRSNADLPCIIVNPALAAKCKVALLNPITNIEKAVELYNSIGFKPWAAAGACNVR